MTTENYLEAMKQSAREILQERRVKQFMSSAFKEGFQFPIDHIIGDLDKHSREYAENWASVANKHEQSGLYNKIAEFAKVGKGIYVDIGCGAGNLLCALPASASLIGADINPYILQIAEAKLKKQGRKVERHSDIKMGFYPAKGLIVRPEALMNRLDLEKVQLISDDTSDLGNTIRALYNNGTRADGAFFTLAGGHSVQRAGEIISAMRYYQTGKDEMQVKSLADIIDPVLANIPFVVKKGGHIYLALRLTTVNQELETIESSLENHIRKNYAGKLEVVREQTIPMMDERKENGISITHHPEGEIEMPVEIKKQISILPYQLNLSELRVK